MIGRIDKLIGVINGFATLEFDLTILASRRRSNMIINIPFIYIYMLRQVDRRPCHLTRANPLRLI